jgi:hypothetical protein
MTDVVQHRDCEFIGFDVHSSDGEAGRSVMKITAQKVAVCKLEC